MLTYLRPTIYLLLCLFLFSCKKDHLAPESDDMSDQAITHHYELKNIRYFLGDDDGIDTSVVKLPALAYTNETSTPTGRKHIMKYNEQLKMQSAFVLDTKQFPEGLILDTMLVKVPFDWYNDGSYSFYTQAFPLVNGFKEVPYDDNSSETYEVTIPPHTKIQLTSTINKHRITCSFLAIFKDKTTGIQDTITGKWKGTLRYNYSKTKIEEYPL